MDPSRTLAFFLSSIEENDCMKRFILLLIAGLAALSPGLGPIEAAAPKNSGSSGRNQPTPIPVLRSITGAPAASDPISISASDPVAALESRSLPPVLPDSAVSQAGRPAVLAQPQNPSGVSWEGAPQRQVAPVQASERQAQATGEGRAAEQSQAVDESLAGEQSQRFDGTQARPGLSPQVKGPVRFTREFADSLERLQRLKGHARWNEVHWAHLRSELLNLLAGGRSTAVLAQRGSAREAGIWKFKWGGSFRIFFHVDQASGELIFLEARVKRDLVAEWEDAFYEELAGRVGNLGERLVLGAREEGLSRRLRLPVLSWNSLRQSGAFGQSGPMSLWT